MSTGSEFVKNLSIYVVDNRKNVEILFTGEWNRKRMTINENTSKIFSGYKYIIIGKLLKVVDIFKDPFI